MFVTLLQHVAETWRVMEKYVPPYLIVAVFTLLSIIVYRVVSKRSKKIPLPTYFVEGNDVIATLERAHKDVMEITSKVREKGLSFNSTPMDHLHFHYLDRIWPSLRIER